MRVMDRETKANYQIRVSDLYNNKARSISINDSRTLDEVFDLIRAFLKEQEK